MSKAEEVKRYAFNLFAFPDGYFENRTAEELKISEEARQELIRMQNDRADAGAYEEHQKQIIKEFEDLLAD